MAFVGKLCDMRAMFHTQALLGIYTYLSNACTKGSCEFERILSGELRAGERLPAIRRCCALFGVSKTTVELAYQQLAAEGYVLPRPQSGYYVTALTPLSARPAQPLPTSIPTAAPRFDLASTSLDRDGFDFTLWQRYLKSALRSRERLLSYGEPQGEYDLRLAVSHYAAESRAVACAPEQIVIGAGVQSLLHLLCALLPQREVAFVGDPFPRGEAIFRDHGLTCVEVGEQFRQIPANSLIYVTPSHGTPLRPPMPVRRRTELLELSARRRCLILEDDYDSEFSFYGKPVPSLQSLDSGGQVLYVGTFSKLLLPAIRISFLVLPPALCPQYRQLAPLYNQTASKTEQLALAAFIRDGRLSLQIRKARRHYLSKNQRFSAALREALPGVTLEESGGIFQLLRMDTTLTPEQLTGRAAKCGLHLSTPYATANGIQLLLSCSTVPAEQLPAAAELLASCF